MCLLNLSNFGNEPDLLPEAMAAFEASKQVFTRETLPVQWAFAENNIGDVHWSLATRGGGKAEFEKAIARFESAKQAFTETGYFPVIPIVDQKIALIKEADGEGAVGRRAFETVSPTRLVFLAAFASLYAAHRQGGLMLRIVLIVVASLLLSPAAATEAGWALLREGGQVVLLRHAMTPGSGDPSNFNVD